MKSMQLFRVLQTAVSQLNKIAVEIYNGEKEVVVALPEAQVHVDALKALLDEEVVAAPPEAQVQVAAEALPGAA